MAGFHLPLVFQGTYDSRKSLHEMIYEMFHVQNCGCEIK